MAFMYETPSFAHDPGYQDFYNAKQGTMIADSGCRLLLCLANPKGPMSEPSCVQDVQSMYTEIALSATVFHGPAWIPQCTGLNGLIMLSQINSSGENARTNATHERLTVERCESSDNDGGCVWTPIYSSTRSKVFYPVNGKTSNAPVLIWNAHSKTAPSLQEASGGSMQATQVSKIASGDISSVVDDPKIDLFSGRNYTNISAQRFDDAVIASTKAGEIASVGPNGSRFMRGDRIVIAGVQLEAFREGAFKKPLTSVKIKTGDSVDTVNPVFGTINGIKTNEIVDYTINGKSIGLPPPAAIASNPVQVDANGLVQYANTDGTLSTIAPANKDVVSNPLDYAPINSDFVIEAK